MFGLTKKKPPFVRLDVVDHPILGRLESSEKGSGVLGGAVTVGGMTIDISVAPDGAPMEVALALAADAVSMLAELDVRCRALVAADFLTSYNSDWRFGAVLKAHGRTEEFEKPLLTEAQFVSALTPAALDVTGAKLLSLSYTAGEMFWGHWVCITSFDGLTLTDTNVELQG